MNGSTPPTPSEAKSELEKPGSETTLGGADAVNDTPGIARYGTTPGSQFEVVAEQPHRPTGNKLTWLAVVVALGIILAYAAGMLR